MFAALLPDPPLQLDRAFVAGQAVALSLRTAALMAACPLCSQPSRQFHSRYARSAHDRPILGRPTLLRLTARRFFSKNTDYPRRVFCEPVPLLLARHAQSTVRWTDALLRRVKQHAPTPAREPTRRFVGVDDWAIRSKQHQRPPTPASPNLRKNLFCSPITCAAPSISTCVPEWTRGPAS